MAGKAREIQRADVPDLEDALGTDLYEQLAVFRQTVRRQNEHQGKLLCQPGLATYVEQF
jgi:hypothetical protein